MSVVARKQWGEKGWEEGIISGGGKPPRRGRGKKGRPVQSKGAKVLKRPPSHVDTRACLLPVVWTTTITDTAASLVLRHVGTPWLFSFDPRRRIPWKIISCVNGRLVLHGASLPIFPFCRRPSLPFFFPLFIGQPATPSKSDCFFLILPVVSCGRITMFYLQNFSPRLRDIFLYRVTRRGMYRDKKQR